MDSKIEKKYLMALYSNIAILNAVEYLKLQNENNNALKESDLEKPRLFSLPQEWLNLLNKINNYAFPKDKENAEFKKQFTIFKKEEVALFFGKYLRLIRNFYSHAPDYQEPLNHKNNKELLTIHEQENLFGKIMTDQRNVKHKIIFLKINNINNDSNDDMRLAFISLFLTNNEIKDLTNDIALLNDDSFKFLKKYLQSNILRQYRFRFQKIAMPKVGNTIQSKIINYFTNYQDSNNKKQAFIKIALTLLRWKYSKVFTIEQEQIEDKANPTIKKPGRAIWKITFLDRQTSYQINFDTLQWLLFCNQINSGLFAKSKLQEVTKAHNQGSSNTNNRKAFLNRLSPESKINNYHLTKLLHKIIIQKQWIKKTINGQEINHLSRTQFQKIFQALNDEDKYLLEHDDFLSKSVMVKIFPNWAKIENQDLKNQIKQYVKGYYQANWENFQKNKTNNNQLTSYKNKSYYQNNDQKQYIYWFNLNQQIANAKGSEGKIQNLVHNSPFQEEVQKSKQHYYNFCQFLAPIISFYHQFFKKYDQNYVQETSQFQQQYWTKEQVDFLFGQRIEQAKNAKINLEMFSTFSKKLCFNQKDAKQKCFDYQIQIPFNLRNQYDIYSSKLFWSFAYFEMVKAKKDLKELILNKEENDNWSTILKNIKNYRKNEYLLIKNKFNDDQLPKADKRKWERNWILHRSLHNFKTLDQLNSFIERSLHQEVNGSWINNKKGIKNNQEQFAEPDKILEQYKAEIAEKY